MTIYGHVPDKTALFDGLVELVLAEVTLPGRSLGSYPVPGQMARPVRNH